PSPRHRSPKLLVPTPTLVPLAVSAAGAPLSPQKASVHKPIHPLTQAVICPPPPASNFRTLVPTPTLVPLAVSAAGAPPTPVKASRPRAGSTYPPPPPRCNCPLPRPEIQFRQDVPT